MINSRDRLGGNHIRDEVKQSRMHGLCQTPPSFERPQNKPYDPPFQLFTFATPEKAAIINLRPRLTKEKMFSHSGVTKDG